MDRRRTAVRVLGVVITPLGFAAMLSGLSDYVARLDVPGVQGNSGLGVFVLGLALLTAGLVLADRGFGRGARGPSLRIEAVPPAHPDAIELIEAVQQEYVARYGGRDETPLTQDAFQPPHGEFFVGYLDDLAVAIGAWRRREDVAALGADQVAELKRMYVVPPAQRHGHARRMLAHLESAARAAGFEVTVLETGDRQPEAIALYESSGYSPIPSFGHYRDAPGSVCYAKRL